MGNQEPRIRVEPARVATDGPDAAELASAYGLVADPWQALVLDSWLGRDENDKFTATSCGLSVPRQNGKNAILEMRELYGATVIGEKILHSAHEVKTHNAAFARLCSFFEDDESFPELAEMLVRIRRTNGQEAIELNNGGVIRFSARSRGAARGMTFDLVVFDEAQELTDIQIAAMMSTMAAAPLGNRQLIYTGTPPGPDSPGEVFGRKRKQAIQGIGKRLAWHEWSVEEIGDITDRERWYETNPGLGIRLDEDFTDEECKSLSEEGFACERLGWWASELGNTEISPDEWAELATTEPPSVDDVPSIGKLAFGVKFSIDGKTVSIAAAIKPRNGTPYVELVDNRSMREGVTWIADLLEPYKAKTAVVVVDGKSHVDDLVAKLHEKGFSAKAVRPPSAADVAAACARFLNAVREKKLRHYGQPALDGAVTAAEKRMIGDKGGHGWKGAGGADVTPVEAVSLGYWGVMTTKRVPGKRVRLL